MKCPQFAVIMWCCGLQFWFKAIHFLNHFNRENRHLAWSMCLSAHWQDCSSPHRYFQGCGSSLPIQKRKDPWETHTWARWGMGCLWSFRIMKWCLLTSITFLFKTFSKEETSCVWAEFPCFSALHLSSMCLLHSREVFHQEHDSECAEGILPNPES